MLFCHCFQRNQYESYLLSVLILPLRLCYEKHTGPLHFTNFSNRAECIGPAYSVYELISHSSLLSQHSSFLNNVAGNVYMPAVWKHQYRIFAVHSKCHLHVIGSSQNLGERKCGNHQFHNITKKS